MRRSFLGGVSLVPRGWDRFWEISTDITVPHEIRMQRVRVRWFLHWRIVDQCGLCWYCGVQMIEGKTEATVDHRMPAWMGFSAEQILSDGLPNGVACCSGCNSKKGPLPEAVFRRVMHKHQTFRRDLFRFVETVLDEFPGRPYYTVLHIMAHVEVLEAMPRPPRKPPRPAVQARLEKQRERYRAKRRKKRQAAAIARKVSIVETRPVT